MASPAHAAAPPTCAEGEGCGRMVGRVRVAGEREAVVSARVVVMPASHSQAAGPPPWTRVATTDAEGRFVVDDVPAGPVRAVVLHQGHARLDHAITVARDAEVSLELYLERELAADYRTVVETQRSVQHGEARSTVLSREEVQTLPGTQGDALRALQNLPGVARPPGGLGLLVLRGAPPWQSLTLLGEHPVPRAFHALPFAAIVQSESLDGLELVPSNASARYGPLTGGVVQLHPHRPRRDGVHGHGQLDITGANASVEGPVGLGSYMVAGRRGWLDGVLRGVENIDGANGYLLPGLWDYQAWLVLPVVGDGELELRVLGVGDKVRNRYFDHEKEEVIDAFVFRSQFHRFDLVGRWTLGRSRLLLSPTLRIGQDHATFTDFIGVWRREVAPGWRAEVDTRIAPRARLVVGTDGTITPFQARVHQPNSFAGGELTDRIENSSGLEATGGAYAIVHFGNDRWRLSPGVRAHGFMFGEARRVALDPRVGARVALGERATLDVGLGRYSQLAITQVSLDGGLVDDLVDQVAPTVVLPPALAASFEPRVPVSGRALGARVITAMQASASVEVELPWQLDLRVGAFVRDFDDPQGATVQTPFGGLVANQSASTTGVDYGGELLLRRRITRRLYGWVAYTLMRSRRDGPDGPSLGDFDQPHNLVALASYRLPRGWRIGGRFRVTSGNPYRPVVGAAQLDELSRAPVSTPIYGVDNSARFPTFHQLDVRIDKQWVRPQATITAYIDVLNVYNRQNVEAWIYQPDFRGKIGAFGLPILPVLGVRVDF
jgi:hypothetical protein